MRAGIRLSIACVAAGAAMASLAAPAPAADTTVGGRGSRPAPAAFSLPDVTSGRLKDLSGVSAESPEGKVMQRHELGVLRAPSGEMAVVDRSSAREGATAAAGSTFVDLSWKAYAPDARYVITRDGKALAHLSAGVVSFRDTDVKPGAVHHYQVAPVLPEGGNPQARLYGLKVTVPTSGSETALREQAVAQARAADVASTTTLSWTTFIPLEKVASPPVGCGDFSGDKFQFGGDHRDYDATSPYYRTALHATIDWSDKSVTEAKDVGETSLYKKGAAAPLAVMTASDENMEARKLGSGSNYVDVRMVMHASNPFCDGVLGFKGGIDGAFTMNLTTSGNWTIRSGKHRPVPNHHIFITDGGQVTDVYKAKYKDLMCLVGELMCPEEDLTAYYGTF